MPRNGHASRALAEGRLDGTPVGSAVDARRREQADRLRSIADQA